MEFLINMLIAIVLTFISSYTLSGLYSKSVIKTIKPFFVGILGFSIIKTLTANDSYYLALSGIIITILILLFFLEKYIEEKEQKTDVETEEDKYEGNRKLLNRLFVFLVVIMPLVLHYK